jgi:predicted phage terminase large subunit-like protein
MGVSLREKYDLFHRHCEDVMRNTTVAKTEPEAVRLERIRRALDDYAFFVLYYFPHFAKCGCGRFQVEAANYIRDHGTMKGVFKWARAHAKSTHMDIFIPLWLKAQKSEKGGGRKGFNVMVIVGKSQENANTLLSDIQAELQYNKRYEQDFGVQYNAGHWSEGEFVTRDETAFFARGRGQSPRGLRYRDSRPDYIVMDDLDDDELCQNESRVSRLTEWVREALFGTLDGGRGRFIMVGNLISKNSVLQRMTEIPGVYVSQVNIYDSRGRVTWKEKWTLEEVREMERFMGYRSFQKEYMNNPINEGSVFALKHIRYDDMLPSLRRYRSLVCYTDPSFKDSMKNDYKATMLVGLTSEGCYHVIRAYAEQAPVSAMIGWHYEVYRYCGDVPVMFYMESNFIQDLILDEFRKAGASVGLQIPIRGDSRKKPDKFARIEALQPLFERGLIVLNEAERKSPGMQQLVEQLLSFERGSRTHDDAPDALEGAVYLLNRRYRTNDVRYVVQRRASRRW